MKIFKIIKAWYSGLTTLIRVSFTGKMTAEDPIVIYAGTSIPGAMKFGRKVISTKIGSKLLNADECELKKKLTDYSYLESLPENSLGKLYLKFYKENSLSDYGSVGDFKKEVKYGHREKRGWNKIDKFQKQSMRFFDEVSWQHDIMHILSNNKADRQGEVGVHAFLIPHLQIPAPKLIVFMMGFVEFFSGNVTIIDTIQKNYNSGKSAKWLFPVDWVQYLEKDINDVRKEFKIQIS